ncbi:MAG: hypothetical protein H0X37_25470, partial [Herpetosiphonaceae bacterium]|nr:hypothetical protein [Herpetosiphonaceae bacterium]
MPDTSRTTTDLNVRSSPEVSPTNQTATLLSGAHFEATGNVGLWLQINHGGQPGFVNGDFTTSLQPVAVPLWTTSVTTPALNLRNQPSMAANSIIGQLTA